MNIISDSLPSAAMLGGGGGVKTNEQRQEEEEWDDLRQPSVDGLASPNSPGTAITAPKPGGRAGLSKEGGAG